MTLEEILRQLIREELQKFFKESDLIITTKPEEVETLPELMKRKEVAKFLSISLTTVDTLSREGVLTKHYIGGSPRFKREEIREVSKTWEPYKRLT